MTNQLPPDQDAIKRLGRAMGYTYGLLTDIYESIIYETIFDPLKNANDDYKVLEWVRTIEAEGLDREGVHFRFAQELSHSYGYQIGDYARAALKVLSPTETEDE